MKSSSGRMRNAATLAATASTSASRDLAPHVSSRNTLRHRLRTSLRISLCVSLRNSLRVALIAALVAGPAASVYAQRAAPMPQGAAVRDDTPEVDASIEQRDWQAALTQLDARIASNPRDAQAKFKRATVLVHLKRDDEAIAAFTELTQLYPELPEPYNNLAALYAKQGNLIEARTALETATKVNPSYGLAWENLGDVYLRMANESYRRAQGLGKASSTTTQRIAQIQQIVSPTGKPAATKRTTAPVEAPRSTTNLIQTPAFQFGGSNGSLAMPPYMAPSQ